MQELTTRDVKIQDSFWSPRLAVNAQKAIFHQWEQLEASHCIDNFRIAAGEQESFRQGFFFADSDAYKWLDAASRIYMLNPEPALASLMDSFIILLERAQMDDGYLFTFNQLHFPGQHWVNLQIEHELYCHGHLIEAGVSHYQATGRRDLLDICIKAADLLVRDFLNASNDKTCGHEEIEIAMIRLYRVTGKENYLELACRFVERRGRIPFFALHILGQLRSYRKREEYVAGLRRNYLEEHPEHASFRLPVDNFAKKPKFSRARWNLNMLRGFYHQQHAPIHRQTAPVGHSVRFGYLETAIAMLLRARPDKRLLVTLEKAWERMVTRRMYVTGGVGAAPEIEGFGGDYDLDPELAYAETCAAISSLLWSWEMTLVTKKAEYGDLFEWQLYNATNVGMGQNGDTYLYNNPLVVHQGVIRQGWYSCPCCPSNLSRTFADLGKYIYSFERDHLWVHQYIGSETAVDLGTLVKVKIESGLPWNGRIRIHLQPEGTRKFAIHLRKPSSEAFTQYEEPTASGYDPRQAEYDVIEKTWDPEGETLVINYDMPIRLRRAHSKVKGHAGKVALTRGPLVYCLESVDNPEVDIFTAQLDTSSVHDELVPDLLGGIVVLHGETTNGKPMKFIPYFLWGNRGESQMTAWVNSA